MARLIRCWCAVKLMQLRLSVKSLPGQECAGVSDFFADGALPEKCRKSRQGQTDLSIKADQRKGGQDHVSQKKG